VQVDLGRCGNGDPCRLDGVGNRWRHGCDANRCGRRGSRLPAGQHPIRQSANGLVGWQGCLGEGARRLASAESWTQVADLSGVSRQAVWSRWRV
jgi:hypothetical protein